MNSEKQLNEYMEAFEKAGVAMPAELMWVIDHRILGFDEFSQLEPWHLCRPHDVQPLSEQWPDLKLQRDLIPFARYQAQNQFACFAIKDGEAVDICEIDMEPPFEITDMHGSIWNWLRHVVGDIELWFQYRT